MKKIMLVIIVLSVFLAMTSCANRTKQQRGTTLGAVIGAAAGATLGQAIGGDTEATLLGAAIGGAVGGLAGNQIGAYMDRQEQELRDALAASEIASIRREQDVLTATFKNDFFFKLNSAVLLPGAQQEMARVADILNRDPQTMIRVEGHTDITGPESYNQALSEDRAQAVAEGLAQRNVNSQRINTLGFGESQAISSNHAMNRRVNIVIIPIRQG